MPKMPVTDVVSIYKQTRTGNTEAYKLAPDYQNVNACISPTGSEVQSSEGGVASYQLFEIFVWDVTVVVGSGDKLVAQDNTEYLVTGSPNTYKNAYAQGTTFTGKVII